MEKEQGGEVEEGWRGLIVLMLKLVMHPVQGQIEGTCGGGGVVVGGGVIVDVVDDVVVVVVMTVIIIVFIIVRLDG